MPRLLDSNVMPKEKEEDISLRPSKLSEYVGQDEIKENFKVFIGAALSRNEVLDHTLIYGPPGLGKTTLAYVIAHEMHANIKFINGPSIERPGDLASILSSLNPGDILFIDEIHRLPHIVEEILYGAMEDYVLSLTIPKDNGVDTLNIDLPPFTLIGATTRSGDLSNPLRSRFGITQKLDYYSTKDLVNIVKRTARVYSTQITDEASYEIAKRSRGTPRIANRLFRRIRDFADYQNTQFIDKKLASKSLKKLKIDPIGLDEVDILYLKTLLYRFDGGPVGVETIANTIGEERMNLEDVYEPYLLQIGFINRTAKGREATTKCDEYMLKFHNIK